MTSVIMRVNQTCTAVMTVRWKRLIGFFFIMTLILSLTPGCGTMRNGRGWGQDATIMPGWKKIGQAAQDAALAPEVWVPVAGALLLQAGDADHRISRWASRKTPVFGSPQAADDISEETNSVAHGLHIATLLITPSGDVPGQWALAKLKGFAVGMAAFSTTTITTNALKDVTGRRRPDASDHASFPSLTTSHAAVSAELASRNIECMPLDESARIGLRAGALSLSALTGWARVEAYKHYPSDVLVGAALGHFLGIFFNNAFLGLDASNGTTVWVEPMAGGFMVNISF